MTELPCKNSHQPRTCWLFLQKSSTTDLESDSKCESNQRCCKCGVWVECKCMEFVAAGLCTWKWLRLYQSIRNLTSCNMGIPLVVIRLGVTGLKKIRLVYILDLFRIREGKGQYDLVCVEHLWMIRLMHGGYVDVIFTCGECGFS